MPCSSLEWVSQGFVWQTTGVEGCCHHSTVHAVQCKRSRFAFFFLICTQLHLLSVRTLIQLGLIIMIMINRSTG